MSDLDYTVLHIDPPGPHQERWLAISPFLNTIVKYPIDGVRFAWLEHPSEAVALLDDMWSPCSILSLAGQRIVTGPFRLAIRRYGDGEVFEVTGTVDHVHSREGDGSPLDQVGPQATCLHLLSLVAFNSLDGATVAADLATNNRWWRAVLPGRIRQGITLRDLADAEANLDTVWIWCRPEHEGEMERLASTWPGAMAHWLAGSDDTRLGWLPESGEGRVLAVWWD